AAASKDSGGAVVQNDSVQCAAVADLATAGAEPHRCDSNRDFDSTCLVVAARFPRVAVNCESDPGAVVPSVAVVPANREPVPGVAARHAVGFPGSDDCAAAPAAVVPNVAAVPANYEFVPDAAVPSVAGVPVNCQFVPGAVVSNAAGVPGSRVAVPALVTVHVVFVQFA